MQTLARREPATIHPLIAVICLVGIPLILVHNLVGTPDGSSSYYNLAWAEGFDEAFWGGDLYPRRIPSQLDGAGALDFFFYGPLPFWVNSTVGRLLCAGCSATDAFPMTGALLLLLSGPAFYVFARRFTAPMGSAMGAAIFVLAPYHLLGDWWARQAVGEIAAYIFIPLLALAVIRAVAGERASLLFGLSLCGLVLSHLPSTLIAAYFLGAFGLFKAWQCRLTPVVLVRPALSLSAGAALGLSLSAIYWLPALALLGDVSPGLLYTSYADPMNWLLFGGRTAPNPVTDLWSAAILLAAAVTAISAFYAFRTGGPEIDSPSTPAALGWVLGPILFAVIMMTVVSAPLWTATPIAKVQFPWRTLLIADLGLAMAATLIAARLQAAPAAGPLSQTTETALTQTRFAALAMAATLLLATLTMLPAVSKAASNAHRGNTAPIATGALEYIPDPFLSRARDAVRAQDGTPSGTGVYVHWYRGIEDAIANLRETSANSAYFREARKVSPRRIEYDLTREAFGRVVLPIPYWEHWTATSLTTGEPIPLAADDTSGGIALNAGPGRTQIALTLPPTDAERLGGALSGLALMLLLALGFRRLRDRHRSGDGS